jgi:hypothetical protein
MRAALVGSFAPLAEARVPYFFRYACRWLRERDDGLAMARELFEEERRRIERGAVVPIGWRWIGEPRQR